MSISELWEWMAYYDLEPFGHPIADRRHVDLCASQSSRPREIAKHVRHKPKYAQKKGPDTADEIVAKLTAIGLMV